MRVAEDQGDPLLTGDRNGARRLFDPLLAGRLGAGGRGEGNKGDSEESGEGQGGRGVTVVSNGHTKNPFNRRANLYYTAGLIERKVIAPRPIPSYNRTCHRKPKRE